MSFQEQWELLQAAELPWITKKRFARLTLLGIVFVAPFVAWKYFDSQEVPVHKIAVPTPQPTPTGDLAVPVREPPIGTTSMCASIAEAFTAYNADAPIHQTALLGVLQQALAERESSGRQTDNAKVKSGYQAWNNGQRREGLELFVEALGCHKP